MQKGFSSIFLVIGILIIVLIGGAIYLGKTNSSNKQSIPSSSSQQATQTPSSDKTADWKTYTNTDYAYQLKYPKTLNTKIPENAPQVFIIYLTEKQDEYLEVEIGGISSLGLDKEIEFDMQRANPSKTTFQNKPAVSVRPARNIYPGEPFKATIIYLEDKKYKIELGYYGNGKNEALFDQILATFQFMNQSNETANWKTFTSSRFNFSLKYPGDWKISGEDLENGQLERIVVGFNPPEYTGTDNSGRIRLSYFQNPKDLSVQEFEKNFYEDFIKKDCEAKGWCLWELEFFRDNDKPVKISNEITGYYREDGYCQPVRCQQYFWSYNKRVFVLTNIPISSEAESKQKEAFNKILSTLKLN